MAEQQSTPRSAPVYQIPSRHIVSVEHPGIVRNVDRAIETLQGSEGITRVSAAELKNIHSIKKIYIYIDIKSYRFWTPIDLMLQPTSF